jgi:ABC-type bacteriocin/lantibiotic exporter with double-glycine peptidase domain
MFFTSICVSIIQTYGISKNIANIINTAQNGNLHEMEMLVKMFVLLCVLYIIFNYLYERFKHTVLTKLRQWIRVELLRILMKSNNENFTDKNFIKLNSPINRISNVAYLFISDLFTYFVPSVIFVLVAITFFTYNDPKMGAVFILANLIMVIYLISIIPTVVKKDHEYEENVNENESHVLEILNNMDKIVYRGQTEAETSNFRKIANETVKKSADFYHYMNLQESILSTLLYVIIVAFLIYNIGQVKNRKMSKVLFITFITIIMLYREKISLIIWQISDFVEFSGRANGVLKHYNDAVLISASNPGDHSHFFQSHTYAPVTLEFNKITFKNVSFKYRTKDTYVFKNLNLELYLNNKIIGLSGVSGRGKSTLMKLALKMYKDYEGDIFIDDVNIRIIDPDYLRKNIVYVNQNSKLFDRYIIENIMYGCGHTTTCDQNIKAIMDKYPKIRELFKDNNIYSTRVGPLGEKMSGGQRMIISILTGLISPASCGLVLDEPTTGLDPVLKNEIIDLIRENRKNKKFIIIISHDKDVYRIFDEKKEI